MSCRLFFLSIIVGSLTILSCAQVIAQNRGGSPVNCSQIERRLTNEFYADNDTLTAAASTLWNLATPASQNMDSQLLTKAADQLSFFWGDLAPQVRSFLVVRNNKLVFEKYYWTADALSSENIHSASKSIWGAAIGIALHKGVIIDKDNRTVNTASVPIYDLLSEKYRQVIDQDIKQNGDSRKLDITLEHLLSMHSSMKWDEDSSEDSIKSQSDWIEQILQLRMEESSDPGSRFTYSTANSHLISAILDESLQRYSRKSNTPARSTCEFIHEFLLTPIGVDAERWGRDDKNFFSGGFDFYITPREFAKFSALYLNKGKYGDTQVIPEDWVNASLTPQFSTKGSTRHVAKYSVVPTAYGYNFWLGKINNTPVAMAWGYCGQMAYIFRSLNLLVVITTDTTVFDCGIASWLAYPEPRVMKEFESAVTLVAKAAR